jgi:Flp pilus assembly pilin Flp
MEYTMIVGVIVMVLMAMNMTIKRGIQGMIKTVADQVGTQVNAEQKFDETGHLERAYTSARSETDKTREEFAGNTRYIYDDLVTTGSDSVNNLGFQKEN